MIAAKIGEKLGGFGMGVPLQWFPRWKRLTELFFRSVVLLAFAVLASLCGGGAIRTVTSLSLSVSTETAALVVAGGVVCIWKWYSSWFAKTQFKFEHWILLVALGLLSLQELWIDRFSGLVSVGGGDGGIHVGYQYLFVHKAPHVYAGFVEFYSLSYWLQYFFGWNTFESFRSVFYLVAFTIVWAYAIWISATVDTATRTGGILKRMIAQLGIGSVSITLINAALHYVQADGFYSHLFGVCVGVLMILAYSLSQSRWVRVAALAGGIPALRFAYGLNLADVAVAIAALLWVEIRRETKPSARLFLQCLSIASAVLAVALYAKLSVLLGAHGAVQPLRHCFVVLGLTLTVGMTFMKSSAEVSDVLRRLIYYFRVLASVNVLVLILLYLFSFPRGYYLEKYPLMALVLGIIVWGVLTTRLVILSKRVLVWKIVLAFVIPICFFASVESYLGSFLERVRGVPPFQKITPLFDPEADRIIGTVLEKKGKRFGGFIAPIWPLSSFMNANRGCFDRFDSSGPGLWRVFAQGSVNDGPGYCVFWWNDPASWMIYRKQKEGDRNLIKTVEALSMDPDRRCVTYRPSWDPEGSIRQELCFVCR